ncbi:MAG TPA: HAMP domain-containing sensor histidine kinase [Candidatus Brocadiia bacterium]|nr:HAMP domain-containing sensor histidine kinase [Candidatus Brocadiia bacterium]
MSAARGGETTEKAARGVYELPMEEHFPGGSEERLSLSRELLVSNAKWFCRLRALVVISLWALGAASYIPSLFSELGLRSRLAWPFAVAALLALANVVFLRQTRSLATSPGARRPKVMLWYQIVFDLVILTCVVHFMGSVETNAPFAYLFHIALACIFFSRRASFSVTLVAAGLYCACVGAEHFGILKPDGIFLGHDARSEEMREWQLALQVLSALGIWFVVWSLVSRLSETVRQRENDLAAANERLLRSQEEKARQMAFTTHELKAPLAALQTNLQLVLNGYCGELPPKAREVLARTDERGTRLAGQIKDMLLLAQLRVTKHESDQKDVDLGEVIEWCVGNLMPLADEKKVVVEKRIGHAMTRGAEEQLRMMFTNLIANAIIYSKDGGRVEIALAREGDGVEAMIKDSGIGIQTGKLSRIFDEYFRTEEAVAHNKVSTGLGLAIVAQVARNHAIKVRVESAPGEGTTFRLRLPG